MGAGFRTIPSVSPVVAAATQSVFTGALRTLTRRCSSSTERGPVGQHSDAWLRVCARQAGPHFAASITSNCRDSRSSANRAPFLDGASCHENLPAFTPSDATDRIQIEPDVLIDTSEAMAALPAAAFAADIPDMISLIRAAMPAAKLRSAEAVVRAQKDRFTRYAAADITWHPPVRTPSKIVCLALNNRALDAIKIRAPTDHPAFFLKPSTALTGHRHPIELRHSFGLTHPEPELGVVIGRRLKHASPDEAMAGVYGYTIVNDITCVGMREQDSFTVRIFKPGGGSVSGPKLHHYRPLQGQPTSRRGSMAVTPTKFRSAAMQIPFFWVIVGASDHTKNYVWSVPMALSHVSRTMTLLPGDIVSMGTAVGGEIDPESPQMPGVTRANLLGMKDNVIVSITGLGTLSNHVTTQDAP